MAFVDFRCADRVWSITIDLTIRTRFYCRVWFRFFPLVALETTNVPLSWQIVVSLYVIIFEVQCLWQQGETTALQVIHPPTQ